MKINTLRKTVQMLKAAPSSTSHRIKYFIFSVALVVVVYVPTEAQGQSTTLFLTSTPLLSSVSINATNASSIASNYTGNVSSSIQPNFTSSIIPYVTPSIISQVSNITATAENVFFIEFKLLSKDWHVDLNSRKSEAFVMLANQVTETINDVYFSKNDSNFNGSRVLGFRNSSREGVYVIVKVEYSKSIIVNVSLVDPLIGFFRAGGVDGFATDMVFFKLSKYADCIVSYIDTKVCQCETKTYKKQMKCFDPEVIGGEECPHHCYTGYQVTGTKPCTWDDLDAFLCTSGICEPHVMTMILITFLTLYRNMHGIL